MTTKILGADQTCYLCRVHGQSFVVLPWRGAGWNAPEGVRAPSGRCAVWSITLSHQGEKKNGRLRRPAQA